MSAQDAAEYAVMITMLAVGYLVGRWHGVVHEEWASDIGADVRWEEASESLKEEWLDGARQAIKGETE